MGEGEKMTISLARLLTRPPYVSVTQSSRIGGDYGHASAIFRRPVIEGLYFLEIVMR